MRVVQLAMMLIAFMVAMATRDAGLARADAVTDCAAAQGKAAAALFVDIYKEAARACGGGSAGAPLAVSQGKVGASVGKFYVKIGKAVDKVGEPSCFYDLETLGDFGVAPDAVLSAVQDLADQGCLVP